MFRLHDHHIISALLVAAIICGSLAVVTGPGRTALASCGSGSSVLITSPSFSGANNATAQTLTGIKSLRAAATPTTASGLTFMLLNGAQQTLGEAVYSGSDWRLEWDSRNVPNGGYQLVAVAHFGTALSLDCASSTMPVNISNAPTQAPALQAVITPNTWQGPTGAAANFTLDVHYTDQYGRKARVTPSGVNWQATIGAPGPGTGLVNTWASGKTLGTGSLSGLAAFNGLTAKAVAQLKVVAPTSGNTGASPTPVTAATPPPSATPIPGGSGTAGTVTPAPTPLSSAEATRLAAMPTIFRPAAPTNADPVVSLPTLSCMEKAVGPARFAEISNGQSQPNAAERKLAADCFSGSQAVPAVLAPITPLRLTELPTTQDVVKLESVQARTMTTKAGEKINGFVLSGTAAPNSTIYIYVFSDPLILRAETDSQGKWSYVLDSSLPSGKHEVYAVTEQDSDTFVRTSAVPIQVAAAAPGVQDGALVVQSGWTAAQTAFTAAAALLVAVALFLLARLLRRRRLARPEVTGPAPTIVMPSTTPPHEPTV